MLHRISSDVDTELRPRKQWQSRLNRIVRSIRPKGLVTIDKARLPVDFWWKVLDKFVMDLELVRSDVVDLARRKLSLVTRRRDSSAYLDFCDFYSLPTLCTGEWGQSPRKFGIKEIRAIRLLTSFSKYDFESDIDKKSVALQTFMKYEALCAATNNQEIFSVIGEDREWDGLGSVDQAFYLPILSYAKTFLARTLGGVDLVEIMNHAHHGPGASVGVPKRLATQLNKWLPPITTSDNAAYLVWRWLVTDDRFRLYRGLDVGLSNGAIGPLEYLSPKELLRSENFSKIHFVPKSAKTFRTIAVEPTGNVALQLAVNSLLREKLARWGLDLTTQEKNQRLAELGSVTDNLVTIDLSGASDCVSLNWLSLLPLEWRELLLQLRMADGVLPDGSVINFQKVSSMGNGFTFGLETLIFSSLLYGVIRHQGEQWKDHISNIAIYGDDIVCPLRFANDLSAVLTRTGFLINREKSFFRGLVRESCGSDFLNGRLISKPSFTDRIDDIVDLRILYNTLFVFSRDSGISLDETLRFVFKYVPDKFRFFGPACDDVVGWFFRTTPCYPLVDFPDWQVKVYRLKRTVLSHPWDAYGEFVKTPLEALLYFDPPKIRGESRYVSLKGTRKTRVRKDSMERGSPHINPGVLRMHSTMALVQFFDW